MSGRDTSSSDPSNRTIWKAIFDGLLSIPVQLWYLITGRKAK
jgi:hypothetical protein